jgi:hypothetical protein
MIYKRKGEMKGQTNTRLISSLLTLSKIYTGVLAARGNHCIERRGTISEFQMGFRKSRRTGGLQIILLY